MSHNELPRHQAKIELEKAKQQLQSQAVSSLLVSLVGLAFVRGLAVVLPIAIVLLAVSYARYQRAKRALAALDKPPEARLLR